MTDDFTNVLVRMPLPLKAQLQRSAFATKRSVTQEINARLEESFQAEETPSTPTQNVSISYRVTDTSHDGSTQESALLALFRQLPPEKQLALLTLLRG